MVTGLVLPLPLELCAIVTPHFRLFWGDSKQGKITIMFVTARFFFRDFARFKFISGASTGMNGRVWTRSSPGSCGGGGLAMADNMRQAAKVHKEDNGSKATKGLKRPPSHRHEHTDAASTGQGSSQAAPGHTA